MTKKLLLMLCLTMATVGCLAMPDGDENKVVKGRFHAIVYLKNGETPEGYLQNQFYVNMPTISRCYHMPSAADSVMRLKVNNKLFEKSMKFRNQDIDSMVTWYDDDPEVRLKWEPEFVDFAFGNQEPTFDAYPSMLLVVYKGTHVKGYLSLYPGYGFKYLFKTSDMPYAKAFLVPDQKFSERRRKTLLKTFSMYPEMEEFIKSLTKDDIKEDLFCILKKLDTTIHR